jgi:hypothetical protein
MLHVWGKREVHAGFWWSKTRERDHLEDPGVDGGGRLRRKKKKWDGGRDGVDLDQDRDRWRTLVNVLMNHRVAYNAGNFFTS